MSCSPTTTTTAPNLRVHRDITGTHTLLAVLGEVDAGTVPILEAALARAGANSALVRVDLSSVEFFGSAGITALLDWQQQITTNGGRLELLVSPDPHTPVRRALEVTGTAETLPLYPTGRTDTTGTRPTPAYR